MWKITDPQGAESYKIRHLIVPHTMGQALDIGCGPWPAWPGMVGYDDHSEYEGIDWRPDVVGDAKDLSRFSDASWDAVFSSHLLEHLDDTVKILQEWWRVIRPGGKLVLYLPHKELYPNMGEEGANPDHLHDFMPADITKAMNEVAEISSWGWTQIEDRVRGQTNEYSFYQVYEKDLSGAETPPTWYRPRERPGKSCLVIRYGGAGDVIQASSVFPGLKEQGYHVTVNTVPIGHELLREDPHVDAFLIQGVGQVPPLELEDYWRRLAEEHDKVINLCESMEGSLLAFPGRRTHAMPLAARHMLMDLNYLEFTHALAEVPPPFSQRFYPSDEERTLARAERDKMGTVPVILWALSGTAVHKTYPWTDIVCAWLLERTDAKVILSGGTAERGLEIAIIQQIAKRFLGLDAETTHEMTLAEILIRLKEHFGGNRLLCRSGLWGRRESSAFCEVADLVIGPETGLLNAAAELATPKIVLLSHSTSHNLTKHWKNTYAIEPRSVACYPCHRMHYSREFCPMHESGTSVCAASIKPEQLMGAIMRAIYGEQEGALEEAAG